MERRRERDWRERDRDRERRKDMTNSHDLVQGLEPKELRSFSDIAIGASAVLARCQGNNNRISGKVFMQDDWFVVIERQSC